MYFEYSILKGVVDVLRQRMKSWTKRSEEKMTVTKVQKYWQHVYIESDNNEKILMFADMCFFLYRFDKGGQTL